MGILYAVAVPLGNLKDITLRALEILQSVDCIACEDTRNTKILLDKYSISTKVIDCHKFNEKQRSRKIAELLNDNGKVALVSDAGTPGICDPGCALQHELILLGHKIVPIPGACALTAFLSAVPRCNEFFAFMGFLPKTSEHKFKLFEKYIATNSVFYESPNRLMDTLSDICTFFGDDKKIAIGRELTKIYEEIKIGTVKDIIDYFSTHTLKGEIVGMIYSDDKMRDDELQILSDIKALKKLSFSDKDIAKIISSLKNVPKNKVYELSVKF